MQTQMIDVATAREIALAQVVPLAAQIEVPLSQALRRTAAADVTAVHAMPHFTNSAMDGFALNSAALGPTPHRLPIAGTIAAGDPVPPALPAGAAMRIFTGAPLPGGADAVVPVEDVAEEAGEVVIAQTPRAGANVRAAGSDQPRGTCLLARGGAIAPHHVGLLAANGIYRVAVTRRPRVAVLSTGDELVVGDRSGAEIHDANRPMLAALATAAGAEVIDAGVVRDEPAALAERLAGLAETADLILTSGGVSMGGRDPIRPAFLAAGGEVAAWRVAVKPGKPVMFGRLGGAAVTGLPGNPFSALVGFHLFAAPQIARLSGRTPAAFAPSRARAGFHWSRHPGRLEVIPVGLAGTDSDGLPVLDRLGNGVSATLFPLASAAGLAVVAAETAEVTPGQPLDWHPFCEG